MWEREIHTCRKVWYIRRNCTRNSQVGKSSSNDPTWEVKMHAHCLCCLAFSCRWSNIFKWTNIISGWINWHPCKPAKFIILQYKCALQQNQIHLNQKLYIYIYIYTTHKGSELWTHPMVCLQVVNLLLEELRPKILADELDGLEMIREPRPLHGIPNNKPQFY